MIQEEIVLPITQSYFSVNIEMTERYGTRLQIEDPIMNKILLSQDSTSLRSASVPLQAVVEGPAAEGKADAGTVVWVAVNLFDRFGNETEPSSDHTVAVTAIGPKTVVFEELEGDAFQYALSPNPVHACKVIDLSKDTSTVSH